MTSCVSHVQMAVPQRADRCSKPASLLFVAALCRFACTDRGQACVGARDLRQKFDPDRRPRCIAVAGQGFPLAALLDVTLLIGGGLKGLWRR